MPANRGRPKAPDSDTHAARVRLLMAARQLFVKCGYAKVSTRQIAEAAGLNAGMIRYYFGDKAGLFEATLRETLAPIIEELSRRARAPQAQDIAAVIGMYYQVMGPNPDLPKLVFRSLHDPGSPEHRIVSRVLGSFVDQAVQSFHVLLNNPGVLRDGIVTNQALLSTIALAVFPFLAPSIMLNKLAISLNPEFLTQFAQHNGTLLSGGMLQAPYTTLDPTTSTR
ncbi:TetR/AcrR family transcriptional regulator [Cellvibrio japonicus]|nr:TetR/AcrR family transcriptional regulator [Cellvibrio japonicus]QEI13822.1 TetR family transcriptional regulator [Cellvibrio japonicus]QEI17396.1 TetR family transcriptional regulator [Cellvibrio japonicus]QEI20972.1 TetR family transcriptional regulator [Cellvibrio japonicus]